MARRSALLTMAPAALLVLLAACGGGGSDDPAPPPPPPAPTATLALAPGSGSVQAGDATTTTVTVTRGGGFTGAVVIAVTGAPAGVTATAGTIAPGASTQVVNITTNAAAAGTSTLSIGGTAAGVTIAPVSFALTVTAPPAAGAASVTVTAPAGSLLMEGGTVPLTATVRDAGGNVLAGQTVSWSSSNTGFATVSDAGVVSGGTAGGPVVITATSGGVSGQLQMRVAKDISSFVSEIRTARGMPAMGGAVVTRDGIAAIGVAGNRVSGGAAVTLSDKWHIGSNLKALTATLAAVAVKEGRISWETKAIDSFPELAATLRPEFLTVTLRDLLAMRSGMDGNPPGNVYGGGTTARGQREWAAGWALSQAPVVARGSYFYSNLAYVTSSAMLERAFGGGNYEDLFSSKLALPSGAPAVGWGPQDAAGANPVGHTRSGGNWVTCANCDNPPGLSGAGRAHMPLANWSRIIAEVMKGDAGQSAVLDQAVLRETFTAHTPVGASDNYGLGWMVTTRPWGGRTVTHTGSNNSNHSVAWVGLDTGVAFLAVINAADHSAGATNTGAALDALVVRMLNWYQNGT